MSLSDAELDALINSNMKFKRLVAIYGKPKPVGSCGDPDANPGDICMESNCVNGKKLVMRCDKTNGCTVHAEIPC